MSDLLRGVIFLDAINLGEAGYGSEHTAGVIDGEAENLLGQRGDVDRVAVKSLGTVVALDIQSGVLRPRPTPYAATLSLHSGK